MKQKTGRFINCKRCGKEKWKYQCQLKIGSPFCSRACAGYQKGHPKPKKAYSWGQGKNNPFWKRGWYKSYQGYIMVRVGVAQYKKRCRVEMEKHIGRPLLSSEIVHHKNEDKTDDRIENLQIMTRAEHCKHHDDGF